MLTNMLGDYMFKQRIGQDRIGLEKWAVQTAPYLYAADTKELLKQTKTAGHELSGRVLILDTDGKIQVDSHNELNGLRFNYPEAAQVLINGHATAYGVHELENQANDIIENSIVSFFPESWVSISTASLVQSSEVIGVITLISSVNEMMQSLRILQNSMLMLFIIVAAVAIAAGMLFSNVLTNPLKELTRGIQRMGRGDFSVRVPEKGRGELFQLAQAFNSMTERIETLDNSRSQFVSDASHELKTPLATMKIMIESLIYQPDMQEELRTEFLSDVNKEIDRLSNIVSDLLTLVHADAHTMVLSRDKMSLAVVVKEAAHRLEPLAAKKQQELLLSLMDSGDMYADKGKLGQVVYNIMENAVKYTQENSKINVVLEKNGKSAVLSIEDNGPGMSQDNIKHIFERFYRVDKARSRETGGTGLGLSIAKQIVTLHSGTIKVESHEGKGSKFIITLPLSNG
ncbi:MAG: HAMP domain-containing sensor histidine kinase [Eubacteriales bacterium]|nr:HAMP domain-containing sensor histidine kinase [Eubacteriales bacterium]